MDTEKRELEEEYRKRIKEIFDRNGKILREFAEEIDTDPVSIDDIVEEWG